MPAGVSPRSGANNTRAPPQLPALASIDCSATSAQQDGPWLPDGSQALLASFAQTKLLPGPGKAAGPRPLVVSSSGVMRVVPIVPILAVLVTGAAATGLVVAQ